MMLTEHVYALTALLPDDEKFGLYSQMRRCAVSIPSNLAEGSKRSTKKDFNHFVHIAKGSAAELETQLLLVANIHALDCSKVLELLIEIHMMLEKLSQHLKKTN